ncbi:hypothetical protein Tdes44962_MAKER07300 [Teratosphaeria destructans]|uniref:Uncharacterized protein n=1 Tax=Teratosphaeria destructans TaxID=418781 RepID=A0A9W7SZ77_9PEZI|nr:hypothetical protein Tdes44962_MAKER07300 [Teratosphaeria destructans]
MERTSPQSNATSPSARTVVSALGSPERADSTVSPSSMRNVKQQGSPPSAAKFNQQVSPSSMRSVKQLGSPPSAPNFNQQFSPSSTRSVSQQVSPLSTRSVSQESSAPAENSNRRPQHTRVSSTDSVTTVVNAPASPDGG